MGFDWEETDKTGMELCADGGEISGPRVEVLPELD